MTESAFALDTAVEQVDDHLWRGEIVPGWRIGVVPNGGYVLAIAGRALSRALPHSDPLGVSVTYCAAAELGPIDCEIELLRAGGSTTFARVTLRQQGQVKAAVTASYSDLERLKGESWSSVVRPEIADWHDLEPLPEHGIEMRQRVNQRYARGRELFSNKGADGSGVFEGWLELADGAAPDALTLLLFADAMAPPVFNVFGVLNWVPTLELSVQVRAKPAPGPVQARFSSRFMTRGLIEEDGELWDSRGELVALSRQLSKVRVDLHKS